ncbi:MAG: class I SAM-dependent methyltransferase [Gemmatimonadota bacterium]
MSSPPGPDRADLLIRIVRTAYEDPAVVARYATVGLWPAEEALVVDFVPDGARVLDLGCGAGRTSVALAEIGLQVVGVDLSEAMVRTARQQAQLAGVEVDFRTMNALDLALPPESFDVALFSYNGIELLPGRGGKRRAFEEVYRILRPGGHFIFCAHSLFALNAFAPMRLKAFAKLCLGRLLGLPVRERELGERFIDEPWEEAKYLQILPPSALKGMLREAGFDLVYFNTRGRIEAGRPWTWTGAWEDGERFYVAQKPGAAPEVGDPSHSEVADPATRADTDKQGGKDQRT